MSVFDIRWLHQLFLEITVSQPWASLSSQYSFKLSCG